MTSTGSTTLYIGPMFAGKTSSMISDVERYDLSILYRNKCLIVKYDKDTRYDQDGKHGMTTHRGDHRNKIPIVRVVSLSSVDVTGIRVIGVDECQFYPDAPEYIDAWASAGIHVICAGLDSTFDDKPFGHIADIIAKSENVYKLKAVCMRCGSDASYTRRIDPDNKLLEDIGGSDKYQAVCRSCR